MGHIFVKICGITRAADAVAAVEAGADAVGFILAPSPRRVSVEEAAALARAAGPSVTRFGVFVDATVGDVVAAVRQAGLDGVQLHGFEDRSFVHELRAQLPSATIFKVVRTAAAARELEAQDLPVDAIFVDPKDGRRPAEPVERLPLEDLRDLPGRVVVAGRLDPDSVGRLVAEVGPWGVDVSAGVETAPGVKDHGKVRAFVAAVREAGGA